MKIEDIDFDLLETTYRRKRRELGEPDLAVEATAEELGMTNKEVLIHIDLEDYVEFLIHEGAIKDINHLNFLSNHFTDEYLNCCGSSYRGK